MRSYVVAAGLSSMLMMGCSRSSPTAPTPTPPVITPPTVVVTPTPPVVVRGPEFSQTFWDMLIHGTFEGINLPLKRLEVSPRLYVRTIDGAGVTIDATTLDVVQNAIINAAHVWGGGLIDIVGVERGPSSHVGDSGWITVQWYGENRDPICGNTKLAAVSGEIDLNYHSANCSCGGASRISPLVAAHEAGHAFGFHHTDSGTDLMYGGTPTSCDHPPSAREVYHAKVAYQSPNGTPN